MKKLIAIAIVVILSNAAYDAGKDALGNIVDLTSRTTIEVR